MLKLHWAEQSYSVRTLKAQENGVERKEKVLNVCVGGRELYRKSFIESKQHTPLGIASYDFIVLAGAECTSGKFYEMEYKVDDVFVFRALLQVVNPVTDIPIVLGTLERYKLLPPSFTPMKAWLTDYDAVVVGHCLRDHDTNEPVFIGGNAQPKDDRSIKDYVNGIGVGFPDFADEACLEYYRGDMREVWANKHDTYDPVFVCGSDNVNERCFTDQKEEDMVELNGLLDEARGIIEEYNLPHFILVNDDVSFNICKDDMEKIVNAAYNSGKK